MTLNENPATILVAGVKLFVLLLAALFLRRLIAARNVAVLLHHSVEGVGILVSVELVTLVRRSERVSVERAHRRGRGSRRLNEERRRDDSQSCKAGGRCRSERESCS
jgi:hypothetical protein